MKTRIVDELINKYCNECEQFDMQRCIEENHNLRERIVCRELNQRDILIIGYRKCPVCNFCKSSRPDLSHHLLSMNDGPHQQLKNQIEHWVNIEDVPRPEIEERLDCSIRGYLRANDLWRNMSESRPTSRMNLSCPITGCNVIRQNASSRVTVSSHMHEYEDEAHNAYRTENGWSHCPVCSRWVAPGRGLICHVANYDDVDHQFFLQQAYDAREQERILRMEEEYTGTENTDYVVCKIPGCRQRGIDLRQHLRFHHKTETLDYITTYKSKLYIEEVMNRGMHDSSWGHRSTTKDGHEAHSWGELFLDDWLHEHNVPHDPHFRPGFGCCSADQAIYIEGVTYYLEFDGMGRDKPDSRWNWKNKLKFYNIQIKNHIIGGYLIIRKDGTRDKDDMKELIADAMNGLLAAENKLEYCNHNNLNTQQTEI